MKSRVSSVLLALLHLHWPISIALIPQALRTEEELTVS